MQMIISFYFNAVYVWDYFQEIARWHKNKLPADTIFKRTQLTSYDSPMGNKVQPKETKKIKLFKFGSVSER